MIGTWEIIVIVLVILVLFGADKIPQFIRALTSGMKEFKNAASNIQDSATQNDHDLDKKNDE